MNQISMEMDPLNNYDYPPYDYPTPLHTMPPYNYDIKMEQPIIPQEFFSHILNNVQEPADKILANLSGASNKINDTPNTVNDTTNRNNDVCKKNDSNGSAGNGNADNGNANNGNASNGSGAKRKSAKGKRSNYWSVKITDENFKFYGCSVCDISYTTLQELDQHVISHKDRVTSYDLKIKNLKKRKKMKKEQKKKKQKKHGVVKTERPAVTVDVEIKPEDGYIGYEKAVDYNNENMPDNDTKDVKPVECCKGNGSDSEERAKANLEKIFKCFACRKQFPLSYYLKLHVRSHTGEKPYMCSVCGQSFITASKLGRHNKRIHLAIRYQCRICYRFFSKFENLTTHFDKKHPDDKLEGEPYDYNAILPYLKELEDEMRLKTEREDPKKEGEIFWGAEEAPKLEEVILPKDESLVAQLEIGIEEVKVDPPDLEIKKEPEDEDAYQRTSSSKCPTIFKKDLESDHEEKKNYVGMKSAHGGMKSDLDGTKSDDDGFKSNDDSVMDDRFSEDDYFPSNTWAVTPKMDDPPPSPKPKKKGTGPLKCTVCHKTMSTASYMRVHMRTHTGEKPFRCYVCGRGFITATKMHRHVLTHGESWEGDTKVKSEDIKAEAVEEEKDSNVKKRAKKAKTRPGKKTKTKTTDPPVKYKTRPHSCEFCGKKFLHLETLKVHKKSHDGEELVLKCTYCLEVVADEASLKDHEAKHSGPKPYLCTICGKSYKKRETMVYHRKHHKPTKDFICSACPKSFNAACKLQRHLASHRTDRFFLRYECPVCAHMFHTKYHVQMHLSTHLKEGLIAEENRSEILAMVLQNARKIPRQTDGSANLSDLMPSDERSRVCNICGEVFQHFYYLEEHLKGHGSKIAVEDINKVEDKKHVCPICSKSFKLHYYLKLHSFTHSKEKPFICQQCGKGFITKGKLKRHLETHTGLKKHQCHICYKFFTRVSYLRIHIRTIHGNQDYNFRMEKGF